MSADIVPFPNSTPSHTQQPRSHQWLRDQIMRRCGKPLSPEQTAVAMATARTVRRQPWTAEDHAAHVAIVVRIAIRSAKRRGVSLQSMLSIPRGWLLKLCDEGDPTSLVVRNWLMGNLAHLPDGFEKEFSTATASTTDSEGV